MQRKKLAITLVELLVVVAIIGILVALLLPTVRRAREPARRNACMSNLKNITLALLAYESNTGALPPAYTVDADGNRLHSWRTLILPYLEQRQLFENIDLSKPWDDPANTKARETVPWIYECPSSERLPGMTNYLGIVGPNCAFSGSVQRKMSEITDDPETTMLVIDVGSDRTVHWMSPYDISEEEVLEYGPESHINHPEIFLAAFLDGHVTAIPLGIDPDVLRAMLTIAGGETMAD